VLYNQGEMKTVLELRGVSKKFDEGEPAVDDVWLAVQQGALHALLGPSGCGKTTLLRMVAGFEWPDRGEVLLHGQRINERKPYERPVTTVFQSYALFPHMTVRENVEFGLKRQGAADIEVRVRRVLEMVQLEGLENRRPAQLSGGQRQRVAVARSLALEPAVLLLDEPLSALDPNLRKQVRGELKALQRRVGITFLMVTHDQEEALSLADRITVMNGGKVEQTGSPEDVYLRPASRFVADFLGTVNWINGVGVRPEATRLSHHRPNGDCPGARVLPGRVAGATFLGDCIHVEARLESGESLIAQVSRLNGQFRAGDSVHVWWHPGDEIAL
jgi:ABC-type Fe3+/spermidine/putrescine transport system ATPase subunit